MINPVGTTSYPTYFSSAGNLQALDMATKTPRAEQPSEKIAPPSSNEDERAANNQNPSGQLSKELITALQGNDEVAQNGPSEQEQAQIDGLQARDREVRTHENAHAAAGGSYAGAPNYEYETGPDGQQYAVGGEVSIDTAPISGSPSATISKMETVIRAALAPAEPSGQDRSVAAAASKQRAEAQAQLNVEKQALRSSDIEANASAADTADNAITPTNNSGSTTINERPSGGGTAAQGSDAIINLFA